jgi:hypothetical protein
MAENLEWHKSSSGPPLTSPRPSILGSGNLNRKRGGGNVHKWARLLTQQMLITVFSLPTKENGK